MSRHLPATHPVFFAKLLTFIALPGEDVLLKLFDLHRRPLDNWLWLARLIDASVLRVPRVNDWRLLVDQQCPVTHIRHRVAHYDQNNVFQYGQTETVEMKRI